MKSQISNFRLDVFFPGEKMNAFLVIAGHYTDLNESDNQQCDGYLTWDLINCLVAQISNAEWEVA